MAISRVGRAAVFPSRFQLIAAMNPCPCGYAGSADGRCSCRPRVVERYAGRVSGPLRDRIDLWVHMPRVRPEEYVRARAPGRIGGGRPRGSPRPGRSQLARSRLRQLAPHRPCPARGCALGAAEQAHAIRLAELEGWSARGIERLLRVARTIADLAASERVRDDPSRRGGALPDARPVAGRARGGGLGCSACRASGPMVQPARPDGPAPQPGRRCRGRGAAAIADGTCARADAASARRIPRSRPTPRPATPSERDAWVHAARSAAAWTGHLRGAARGVRLGLRGARGSRRPAVPSGFGEGRRRWPSAAGGRPAADADCSTASIQARAPVGAARRGAARSRDRGGRGGRICEAVQCRAADRGAVRVARPDGRHPGRSGVPGTSPRRRHAAAAAVRAGLGGERSRSRAHGGRGRHAPAHGQGPLDGGWIASALARAGAGRGVGAGRRDRRRRPRGGRSGRAGRPSRCSAVATRACSRALTNGSRTRSSRPAAPSCPSTHPDTAPAGARSRGGTAWSAGCRTRWWSWRPASAAAR